MLEELQRLYGGCLVIKKKGGSHHRQAWTWRMHGTDKVVAFLAQVLPHMRCAVKAARARMLVEELKTITVRNGRYTAETAARKLDFERRFMASGPAPRPGW